MTAIDLDALTAQDRYKLLCGVVVPRPIAWVTTVSAAGVVNAAPYSFFNLFGKDPALVILGLENRADGSRKDTARNIEETGEFVVNILTPDLTGAMVDTAAAYPADVGEPKALGLALAASTRVAPPRLADAPAAIECRKTLTLSLSRERDIVLGTAIGLVTRPGLVDTERMHVDWGADFPVARLFADRYARLVEIDRHTIPKLD